MPLQLKPETGQLLKEELRAGRFGSIDDLIVEGLHALREIQGGPDDLEEDEEIYQAVSEGLRQVENGEGLAWPAVREELRKKHRL